MLKIFIFSALVWVLTALSFFPLYWAFDLQTKSLQSLLILTVIIAIFTTVLSTPAFLGSFQAGVFVALHEIMNEIEVSAVSFGLVMWILDILAVLTGGIYFILRDGITLRQKDSGWLGVFRRS